jgi:DNA polymerase III subunit epsilon
MLGGGLARFAELTDRVVVIDTETTGLLTQDRVIEVAVVSLDLTGRIIDEWDTLINPDRDVGPAWLHGITPAMLADAPRFDEVAAEIAARLHGAVVCAHNLRFDALMLGREYDRAGLEIDWGTGLDTLAVTGAKLAVACQIAGIVLTGNHRALVDARATAALAIAVADRFTVATPARLLTPVPHLGSYPRRSRAAGEDAFSAPPTFLAQLVARVSHAIDDGAAAAYLDLLDRVMSDLHLDDDEAAEMVELAHSLGLEDGHIARIHRRWVDDLVALAAADGVVDGDEYDQLLRAAYVLDVDDARVHERTVTERSEVVPVELSPGIGVCFTGEAVDAQGRELPRSALEAHALRLGLQVESSFTRSRCELLVAADAASQSGKAAKARKWGIPIVTVSDFLAAAPGVSVPAVQIAVGGLQALRCGWCGAVFTASSRQVRCEDCRTPAARRSCPGPVHPEDPQLEVLVCRACGATFERVRVRGRKPHHCPSCAD